MRIFFIAGFGEEENIFEHLKDKISGDKIFLTLWNLLPDKADKNLNASVLARQIIKEYNITKDDVIIGHSPEDG